MHLEARTLRAKKLQAFVQVSSDYRGDIFSAWGQWVCPFFFVYTRTANDICRSVKPYKHTCNNKQLMQS